MIDPVEFTAEDIQELQRVGKELDKKREEKLKNKIFFDSGILYGHIEKMAAAWLKENPGLSPSDAVIVWDTRNPLVTSITIKRRE